MTPARIMIVEDDRVVARDIKQQLGRIGHNVLGTFARGEEAISRASETRPDLILMDIRLEGGLDGIDTAERIRGLCGSPVVFLTAYTDDETVTRASRTEPFGYLIKPFEDSQLRTVIEMALYKHGAEQRLRESERRYATTLSSIGDGVIATDADAKVTFMNPTAEALTGWSVEEAVGRSIREIFHIVNEETRNPVDDPAVKALELRTAVGLANHTVLIARNGLELPIDDCGAPIIDDRGSLSGAVLVFRDMTARHQADEALRQAHHALEHVSRLTAMGELTVSIAHEISQPLMAIVTNAATCIRWLRDGHVNVEEARLAAERIVSVGHHAGDVISSIRALASKSRPQVAEVDVRDAITDVLGLLRSELRQLRVAVELDLGADSGRALGDRIQIQQVLLNLVKNGLEAICANQGQLRLLRIASKRSEEGQVLISVADTGIGIEPAVSERIFDAFFTTKEDGVGMGLSICRSIVERHGGRLWVAPNVPTGCVFHFALPAIEDKRTDVSSS